VTTWRLRKLEGLWHVSVPRFFQTVGDHWSFRQQDEWMTFITRDGNQTGRTCIEDLDVEASLAQFKPSLIVGPEGPLFFDALSEDAGDVSAAAHALMTLPGGTPVHAVDFHR
jgi:hypothetical protein